MASALVELPRLVPGFDRNVSDYKEAFLTGPHAYKPDAETKGTETQPPAAFPNYLPTWDTEKKYTPLQPFTCYEHGKDADPTFPNLLKDAKVTDLTANIGAEIHGIQLSQKKVVAESSLNKGGYQDRAKASNSFIQQAERQKGFSEVHLVHRGAEDTTAKDFFEERTNFVTWHSDVTYEEQPSGTTFLYLLDGPTAGGDTLFGSQTEAYKRLSPEFRKRLHGLKAVHTVARRIVGFKKEESDYLLKLLFDHIALGQDFQARVKWAPGIVVVWDNRVTAHSAILDWDDGQRRHLARITPQAERPVETPFEG